MSIQKAWNAGQGKFKALLAGGLLALTVSGAGMAAPGDASAADKSRTTVSTHYATGGRAHPGLSGESKNEYPALVTDGERARIETRAGAAKPGTGATYAKGSAYDFWIFDADVVLFNDDDDDGYFHGIDLLFDADTVYSAAEVYAVVYLSLDFGPWNEYAATEDFWIYGATGDDEYVLITELMSGFPTGDYDLLIELFDANDHSFLASFGPEDSTAMSLLPLEDYDRDEPFRPTQVTVSRGGGGGGSAGGWTLGFLVVMLFASAGRKAWQRRNDELVRIDSPAPCWRAPGSRQH